jgi:hypothetical protein
MIMRGETCCTITLRRQKMSSILDNRRAQTKSRRRSRRSPSGRRRRSGLCWNCQLEIAKLLLILTEYHGYRSKRFVNFALAHGVRTRTDAYDLLHLAEQADAIVAEHEAATQDDPHHEWPSWR